MIRIEIKSSDTTSRSFTGKDGQGKTVRLQEGYAFLSGAYPERIELALWDKPAYPPGFYVLSPSSCFVNRYRQLELKRTVDLTPLKQP